MADNKESRESPIDMSGHLGKGQPLSEVSPTSESGEAFQLGQPISEITVSDSMPISEIRPTPQPDSSKEPPSGKK